MYNPELCEEMLAAMTKHDNWTPEQTGFQLIGVWISAVFGKNPEGRYYTAVELDVDNNTIIVSHYTKLGLYCFCESTDDDLNNPCTEDKHLINRLKFYLPEQEINIDVLLKELMIARLQLC